MQKMIAHLVGKTISTNDSEAFTLLNKSQFGERVGEKIQYSFAEAIYLVEKKKMEIKLKDKIISREELMNQLQKIDKKVEIKYAVFKNLRDKGYIVKSALKFGADFRVYDKSAKISEEHARWIVFVDHESGKLSWHEFSARNRVSHSTRKKLLLAVVDEESDVTYYEVDWVRV